MKKLTIILCVSFLLTSCDFFKSNEDKAIEIVKKSQVQIIPEEFSDNPFLKQYQQELTKQLTGLDPNSTWLDFANMEAKKNPNKKFDWKARKTPENNIFLVSFVDNNDWGQNWEVDIEQQVVKFINQNEYLSRKYGFSRFDPDQKFTVSGITLDTLKFEKSSSIFSSKTSKKIVYILKGSVANNTGRPLSKAEISGELQIIFKDKTVKGKSDFDLNISGSKPWESGAEKVFYLKTEGVDLIYLDYIPEYVFFEVNMKAEDPIGFSYNKGIKEFDLKNRWLSFKK